MDPSLTVPSVTLIIKAPNQKIADHEVNCLSDWTVRNLKEHLAAVYPNKPKENQQRIIYSGQLLNDNQKLRDVLSQSSFVKSQTHVMHLVWSPPQQEYDHVDTQPVESSESTLRHRRPAPASFNVHNVEASPSVSQSAASVSTTPATQPVYTPAHVTPMSPAYSSEHVAWMQHIYAQQWAHYMQYMHLYQPGQHMGAAFTHPPGVNQAHVVPPAYINEVPAQVPAAAAAAQPANAVPRGGVMQNQMGAMMDDDEENGGNRDWLDHVYSVCRFILLFAMIYFYSSMDRLIIVVSLFLSVYMFHIGWLQLRRRAPPVENNQQQQQQRVVPQPADGEQRPAASENGDNAPTEPAGETMSPGAIVAPPVNYGAICWQFVSSFFTSLIPHQPVPVQ